MVRIHRCEAAASGDGRVRALIMCMEESTHSRLAEMSVVLPHPTLLVVMRANVRDMICGWA